MGHYWSEMRGPETDAERDRRVANDLVRKLRKLGAADFTVEELAVLLKTNWGRFQEEYRASECEIIFSLAKRHRIKFDLKKIDE